MGRLAEALADVVILTDDNPRDEASAAILADILDGMEAPRTARVVPDRAQAIAVAIDQAGSEDTVLVAGKGHEAWQQIGDQRLPFSDIAQVQQLLGGQA
jgi:UDP-N-acetylmuramoyl-L-alanyl-D-glutamate--2,6-diaminopimelate ligase